ncbi:peptidoglycan-binding protein [Streptomyces sp. ML-6]|uniref:peptidoglycan-binding protein n=1 Tax=Streptomyces sp. ML-6 TaxID=2982693 RepID=UPI0024BF9EAD|nr:peptidoglycan-binding protein [Streptomyces sp. ML-6]MDK0523385.1 peptidoglycan-binding protein [Streptomyces sp. ML-6]
MTDKTAAGHGPHPGRALAELLRTWWESSARDGREKPTQQSLAKRLGIDQTTLSRYLNPSHSSNAPRRIVEQLHTVLRAPADDLARACALAEAAAGAAPGRRRTAVAQPPGPSAKSGAARSAGSAAVGAKEAVTPAGSGTGEAPGSATAGTDTAGAGAGAGAPAAVGPVDAPGPGARRWDRFPVAFPTLAVSALLLLVFGGLAWWAAPAPGRNDAKTTAEVTDRPSEGTAWPLARKGNVLWKARTVQLLLRAHGHDVKVDADYGPATAEAVKKFQSAHGLTPDGKVGKDTWPLLIVAIDSGTKEPEAITAVQYLLHQAGVPTDSTGAYTPSTMRSLKEFQASRNLPVTGVGDEDTWRALLNAQGPDQHK